MATFVLVPGAWLGGWAWKRVTPYLLNKQHTVYTPTLTGLGERAHLTAPNVDLDTHIMDIVNVLEYEDLKEVILVGHSYSGMVVTGVADKVPDRLEHLVYLDAIVPRADQSLFDDWSEAGQAYVREEARLSGLDWCWPLPEDLEEMSSLDGFSQADLQWMRSKSAPQPLKTFSQPLNASSTRIAQTSRSYILCTAERSKFPDYVQHARISSDWGFYELPTGHWPMITLPEELSNILLEIAKNTAAD